MFNHRSRHAIRGRPEFTKARTPIAKDNSSQKTQIYCTSILSIFLASYKQNKRDIHLANRNEDYFWHTFVWLQGPSSQVRNNIRCRRLRYGFGP